MKKYKAELELTSIKDDVVVLAKNRNEAYKLAEDTLAKGDVDFDMYLEKVTIKKFKKDYDEDRLLIIRKQGNVGDGHGNYSNTDKSIKKMRKLLADE